MTLPMMTTIYALHVIVGHTSDQSLLCNVTKYVLYLFMSLSSICRPAILTIGSSGRLTREIGACIPRNIICSCSGVDFCNIGFCLGSHVQRVRGRHPSDRRNCLLIPMGRRRGVLKRLRRACRLRGVFHASEHDYSVHGRVYVCGFETVSVRGPWFVARGSWLGVGPVSVVGGCCPRRGRLQRVLLARDHSMTSGSL